MARDEVFLSAGLDQAELGRCDEHGEVVEVWGVALVVAEAQLGPAHAVLRRHAARRQECVAAARAQLIFDRARPEREPAALRVVELARGDDQAVGGGGAVVVRATRVLQLQKSRRRAGAEAGTTTREGQSEGERDGREQRIHGVSHKESRWFKPSSRSQGKGSSTDELT